MTLGNGGRYPEPTGTIPKHTRGENMALSDNRIVNVNTGNTEGSTNGFCSK